MRLVLWVIATVSTALVHAEAHLGHAAPSSTRLARIEWLHDPSAALGIVDVTSGPASKHFETVDHARILGTRHGYIWLRLTVEGGTNDSEPKWLVLNSPLLLESRLYTPTAAGYSQSPDLGLLGSASDRELPVRTPVFRIFPKPAATQIYFVRERSDVVMLAAPQLLNTADLLSSIKQKQLFLGLLYACHAVLLLSSLWFARQARDRSYMWLAALTGANLAFTFATESLLLRDAMDGHTRWIMPLMSVVWSARLPIAAAFVASYLRVNRQPWYAFYQRLLIGAAFAYSIASLSGGPQLWVSWHHKWAIAHVCLFLVFAAYKASRGVPGALLLTLGWLPPLAGASLNLSSLRDGQPLSFWSQNSLAIGFAGFLLVMQYAATRRYRDVSLALGRAQTDALEVSHRAERLLEERVEARTRELNAALVTARSSLEAEERGRAQQRQFFLTVQHELRTPLGIIDAANRNLKLDLPADLAVCHLRCERIDKAVKQLHKLLEDSMRRERVEDPEGDVRVLQTELVSMINDACDAARLLSSAHPVVLDLKDLPSHWACDPALTVLALRTLIVNAVRYTPDGTRITIRGYSDESGLSIEVRDEGPGVRSDELPHLFENYYRASNAGNIPGTGLGLPLARKMIEMQSGLLEIDSVENQGFTARIWLPPHQAPAS